MTTSDAAWYDDGSFYLPGGFLTCAGISAHGTNSFMSRAEDCTCERCLVPQHCWRHQLENTPTTLSSADQQATHRSTDAGLPRIKRKVHQNDAPLKHESNAAKKHDACSHMCMPKKGQHLLGFSFVELRRNYFSQKKYLWNSVHAPSFTMNLHKTPKQLTVLYFLGISLVNYFS